MVSNASTPARIRGTLLILARLAWALILVYSLGKIALGTPLAYRELQAVCVESQEDCSQLIGPTTQDAADIAATGLSLERFAQLATGFELLTALVWIGIGIIIFALRSDDWMALLVSAMMIMLPTGWESDPITRAYSSLAWPATAGFNLQNILLFLVIGLFPSGRFVPRWMRWYWLAMITLSILPSDLDFLWGIGWLSFLTLGPFSQIYRYVKSSNPIERTQTKWVVYGFTVFAVALLTGILFQEIGLIPEIFMSRFLFGLFALFIPLGFAVSILRYRLWDIDVLIRRTLVYTVLTVTLGLVFFGSITLLQAIFSAVSGQRSAVVTVISTLIIAALFNPLRGRIQEGIDRRFFRRKYDAERIVEDFGARLRNEVDLDDISRHLLEAVGETLQPEHVGLWIRRTTDDRRPPTEDGIKL